MEGIPPALDALVMSLLSTDPLSRPAPGAVIDQLTLIGELEPEEYEAAAESYLSSSRMAGRELEQAWFDRCALSALAGSGAEIVLEGPAGIGRTRLLHEFALQALLRGFLVAKADAQLCSEPFSTAAVLASELLATAPTLARECLAGGAPLLVHLSSALAQQLGDVVPAKLSSNPSERRARFQAALHEWIVSLARHHPLLLAVDNIQAADDNSASLLATLGLEAPTNRLVVMATQRSGDAVIAPVPLRALRKRASQVKLGPLSPQACTELVGSLFGEVENVSRVSQLLHERSAGNPQQCMDLAALLVRRKIAGYDAGTWVLPSEISEHELPSKVEEILAARLVDLSPEALHMAELLSVHQRPISLATCLALAKGGDDRAVYAALDTLIAAQILWFENGSYRFAQQPLRAALMNSIDRERLLECHRRAAEVLAGAGREDLGLRMDAAWHMLSSGDESRGADLLAELGRGFIAAGKWDLDTELVVRALLMALEVYEREGRPIHAIADVLLSIATLAFFSGQWRLNAKYGERAIELGLQVLGLRRSRELERAIGSKAALAIGLASGLLGFIRYRRASGSSFGAKAAINGLSLATPATLAALLVCYDVPAVERIRDQLLPFTFFGKRQPPGQIYEFATRQLWVAQGRYADIIHDFEASRAALYRPNMVRALGEEPVKIIAGAMLTVTGMAHAHCFGDQALRFAAELDALGVAFWHSYAEELRLFYHAFRGESEQQQLHRTRHERHALQGGITSQSEIARLVGLLQVDILTRNAVGTRRAFELLSRLARDLPSLLVFARAAHAAHLSLRGQLPEAIALFDAILPELRPRERAWWLGFRACFADTLNRAGQHARAKQVLQGALSHLHPQDEIRVAECLEPYRQLALAEAGLGNHTEAVVRLDELLARHGHQDHPLLIGLPHKARAEVALRMRDRGEFDRQFDAMQTRFRATKNPALVAQCEQLLNRAVQAGLRRSEDAALQVLGTWLRDASSSPTQPLELESGSDPFESLLLVVMQRTQATSGQLYLVAGREVRRVAAQAAQGARPALETELHQRVAHAQTRHEQEPASTPPPTHLRCELSMDAASDEDSFTRLESPSPGCTIILEAARTPAREASYHIALLEARRPGGLARTIGALILEGAPLQLQAPTEALLEQIGSTLEAALAATKVTA